MAAIATKSTVLGVMEESTEGTPVVPASATDFIAIQGDLELTKGIKRAENLELTGSIGKAKGVITGESPSGSVSHYMRASGTAGTAPNYGKFIKSFMGSVTANGTERTTASSSTTSLLKVASNASDFVRGSAVLIKDPVNGYRVRAVDGYNSTTDINLGFQVPTAPGSGVGLGKCVYYTPVNSGHPTLTIWDYVGNGGLKRMQAGCRVTDMSVEIASQELINGSFSWSAVKSYENPIQITSSTKYLDFEDDDGDFSCAVPVQWYADPYELGEALQTAMNAANPSDATKVVTFQKADGKYKITAPGNTTFELKFNTGSNTANTIAAKIGFSAAADKTGADGDTGYTSDNAQTYNASYTPTYDSAIPLAAKAMEVMIGDASDYACFAAQKISISATNGRKELMSLCENSGIESSLINERTIKISVVATKLAQHDVDMFKRLRLGTSSKIQITTGEKTGGNWTPGKVVYYYSPTCNIADCVVTDDDGVAGLELEIECHVENGLPEFYIGML